MKKLPDFKYEKELWKKGFLVIGVDEVGRGAFAGPLVVSAVIFKPPPFLLRANEMSREVLVRSSRPRLNRGSNKKTIESLGINDSKQLSPKKREELSKIIKKTALCHATVSMPVSIINKHGIGKSTHIAVRKLVSKIKLKVISKNTGKYFLLMDAFTIKYIRGIGLKNQKGIIKGDCISISIAAASIIAKVHRDTYMKKLSKKYPEYGFENHVGYGTLSHRIAIKKNGVSNHHRKDFVKKTLFDMINLDED